MVVLLVPLGPEEILSKHKLDPYLKMSNTLPSQKKVQNPTMASNSYIITFLIQLTGHWAPASWISLIFLKFTRVFQTGDVRICFSLCVESSSHWSLPHALGSLIKRDLLRGLTSSHSCLITISFSRTVSLGQLLLSEMIF